MKKHTRNLLIFIPFLPLLMANSPAPRRDSYKDFEVSYLSVETLHGYNFYHFNLKNVGESYAYYVSFDNKPGDKSFYATLESNEICPPFDYVLVEPGFNKEVVLASKNEIAESKEVVATAYDYYVVVENLPFSGSMDVSYSLADSYPANNNYVYKVNANYFGTIDTDYGYVAAIKLTYDGETCVVRSDSISHLYFSTNEQLDLEKLTVDSVTMLRTPEAHEYGGYYYGYGCRNFLNTMLIFFLVFFLLLGFGIFSAIFFPAMARRRRQRALLEQDKK